MKTIKITLLSAALLTLTFIRENIFLVLNGAISGSDSYKAYLKIPGWLMSFTNTELIVSKWALTIILILIFAYLSIQLMEILFKSSKYKKITIYTFLVLSIISLMLYMFSVVGISALYWPARKLLTLLQSPLILMILVSLAFAQQKGEVDET